MQITWKDVLDCKIGATPTISDAEILADKTKYKLFCFNGKVYGRVVFNSYDRTDTRFAELPFIKEGDL